LEAWAAPFKIHKDPLPPHPDERTEEARKVRNSTKNQKTKERRESRAAREEWLAKKRGGVAPGGSSTSEQVKEEVEEVSGDPLGGNCTSEGSGRVPTELAGASPVSKGAKGVLEQASVPGPEWRRRSEAQVARAAGEGAAPGGVGSLRVEGSRSEDAPEPSSAVPAEIPAAEGGGGGPPGMLDAAATSRGSGPEEGETAQPRRRWGLPGGGVATVMDGGRAAADGGGSSLEKGFPRVPAKGEGMRGSASGGESSARPLSKGATAAEVGATFDSQRSTSETKAAADAREGAAEAERPSEAANR